MFRWWAAVRIGVFGFVFASYSSAALGADPLTLFLLRMLRDQVLSSAIESGVTASQQPRKPETAAAARPAPPPTEGQWLKGLIDESFIHLGTQQREDLHASLMKILADPGNAAVRSDILAEFTRQAITTRDANQRLSRLSEADMKVIAAEARGEFERLPPEQRRQLMQALQHGVPGMPRALHELMMAEFASVPQAR